MKFNKLFITSISLLISISILSENSYAADKKKKGKTTSTQTTEQTVTTESQPTHDGGSVATGDLPFGKWLAGGIVGTAVGLGIGHAIHNSYKDKGWKFTVIDSVGYVSMIVGAAMFFTDSGSTGGKILYFGGLATVLGSRGWQAYDLWTTPHLDPKGSRAFEERKFTPILAATPRGGLLGLNVRF